MSLKPSHILASTLTAFVLLTGCTAAFLDTAAHGIFTQEKINFREKNYAAADYLIGQAQNFIGRHDYIYAQSLHDTKQPGMPTDFGKMIPEQIGIRMSQLGYKMNLESVVTSPDTNYLKPPSDANASPDFILAGSYLRGRTEVDISVRLIQTKTARVLAAYDYQVPLTREINDMATPKPQIMRMEATGAPTAAPVPEVATSSPVTP